ncbi:hypothetical protein AB0D04_17415 [Streptomyces sp. NPDC048483]|uniref:hypothetical protein n=1 Tax=Streptomyces sp. NPDC048483 TaxID=3154927 RepID=UPI003449A926
MGHELQGIEGVYSHTTLAMELKIAETLQERWEQSLKLVIDHRELGPILPYISQPSSWSPKFLPGAHLLLFWSREDPTS